MNPNNKKTLGLEYFLREDRLSQLFAPEVEKASRDLDKGGRFRASHLRPDQIRTLIYRAIEPGQLEDMTTDGQAARMFAAAYGSAPDFAIELIRLVRARWNTKKGRKQIVARYWLLNRLPFMGSAISDAELASNAMIETGLDIRDQDIKTARKRFI
jgi:hypothetical protein